MDNFIPRRQAPLKEGRSHPFHYPSSSRRRTISPRSIVIIVGVSVACVLGYLWVSASNGASNGQSVKAAFERAQNVPPIQDTAVKAPMDAPIVVDPNPPPPAAIPEAHAEPHFAPELKSDHSTSSQQSLGSEGDALALAKRPNFADALERVLALLPDEMHQRELLRDFDGTGKERLREIGLRARAYKNFFEAWENLHLVIEDTSTYVRDDILGYLRAHFDPSEGTRSFAQTMRTYESFRFFLSRLSSGRGIVMTAGDEQAPYLLASIPSFRKLGCYLPIEIMYLGDSDLSEDFRAELEQMDGVSTRDLSQMVSDQGWTLRGWAGKPFTILLSSFREVIFVDADALFFHNPEVLFDDPDYQKTGALFFKDRLIMPESKKRWLQAVLPKPISKLVRQSRMWTGESGHMQESGVVVVDKWRHFVALLLVSRMNGPDRDGNKEKGIVGIYDMVYGDKETFWIGWELVGDTDYAFHQGDAGIMGQVEVGPPAEEHPEDHHDDDQHHRHPKARKHAPGHENDLTICSPQLLHLDLHGKPLWFNGWLYHNKFAGNKKQGGQFDVYMKEPREILDPGAWQLEESNMCCLSNKEVHEFTAEERSKLEMIIQYAKEAGSYKTDAA